MQSENCRQRKYSQGKDLEVGGKQKVGSGSRRRRWRSQWQLHQNAVSASHFSLIVSKCRVLCKLELDMSPHLAA